MGSDTRPLEESGSRVKTAAELIEEIEQTITPTPTLWWLGHAGFVVRFATITFYVDPYLSCAGSLLDPGQIRHADLILATHAHARHLDAASIVPMLAACSRAKVVLPKSTSEHAHAAGIDYARMTTTDSDLRVEYWKDNLYGRVYAVPSAHPQLDWTASGGYPYLGYLIRFGRWTIYHAGDCAPYEGLAGRLRPFNVNVALLPVGGRNFSASDAAGLASDIGARWLVPMHTSSADESAFVDHMLGQRPDQSFKVFEPGEKWTVPEE
jgi:L-ascorbate metabolism protein UlaG (beta-lactamase superfamily)